jgi:hypothetical protein
MAILSGIAWQANAPAAFTAGVDAPRSAQ